MQIESRIADRSAVVGIIGLGYVGLPLLATFHAAGFRVIGFDVDPAKPAALLRGEVYLKHLGHSLAADMVRAGRFDATTDMRRFGECDALISCVPTPLGQHLEPDLRFIERCADDIGRTLRPGQLIVLESSTFPGTTRQIMLPRLERAGMRCGVDFFLAYSPERENPGPSLPPPSPRPPFSPLTSSGKEYTTRTIPKLVGGIDPRSGEIAVALYSAAIEKVIPVATAEIAEAAKILENVYRAVNIALVNEMKRILSAMDIDVWEVIRAASTKPFGFAPFYPGPGLGGHCIPIDPYYLTWKARELGLPTRFIELAGEVNRGMPEYVVQKTSLALNDRGKPVKGSRLLILGLAYKPDVDDVRESPSFALIEQLESLGATVDYNDPHVPATHKMRRHDLNRTSVPLTPQSLAGYDAVLIATNHSAYEWQMIADHAGLIIDTRDAMRNVSGRREHIVKA